ncbi:MAG: TonB-dependent receptor [Pseudomonadales bacterium]|nr:TonB-dependent receptor [Pseudomonadales bacterium]
MIDRAWSRGRGRVVLSCLFLVAGTLPWGAQAAAASPAQTPDAAAPDATAPDAIDEEIVVLGSRTPIRPAALAGAPQRLDPAALRDSDTAFLTELLRTLPTASVSRAGGTGAFTQVRVRGAEADHALVLIDGFEGNDPAAASQFDFSQVRATTLAGAELLPGPSGALWGSDALAGALYLRTPDAGDGGLGLRLAGGERDTRELTARAAWGTNDSGLTALVDRFRTDGTNVARSGTEDDGYRIDTLVLRGDLALGERARLTGTVRSIDAQLESDPTPGPTFLPADGAVTADTQRTLAGLRLDLDGRGAWRHRLTGELLSSKALDATDGVRTDQRRGGRLRLNWQSAVDFEAGLPGRQRLLLAAEQEQEDFDQIGAASIFGDPNQRQTLTNRSLLAEWRLEAAAGPALTAAARRDFNEAFSDATTWRLGLRQPLPGRLGAVWVNAATGQKNPTFTERFGFTPDTFFGNEALRPERSRSVELGWTGRFDDDRGRMEVLWHRTALEDEIDSFVFDAALGGFTARNRGRDSTREGVEALLAWAPTPNRSLSLRYAFLDATEPAGDSARVTEIRRPRHAASLSVTQAFTAVPLTLRLDASWQDERDDLDFATFPAETVTLDDYLLLNVAANWQATPGLKLFLRGENLTDATYEEVWGYATPGRALFAGVVFGALR